VPAFRLSAARRTGGEPRPRDRAVGSRHGQIGERVVSQSGTVASPVPAIAWHWSAALLGALCALPAAAVTVQNPSHGLALAVGALPAAAVGVAGPRRGRHAIVIVGLCIGLGLMLGAVLGRHWLLAVGGIFLLALGSAILSGRRPIGRLLMALAVPMVGAGLSFDSVRSATDAAVLMAIGSATGWLLALCWPERRAAHPPTSAPIARAALVEYGIRLGLAGAICAGLGFALDLDHKGWATAACLLVMRPTAEMTRLRAAGRLIAVITGALAACIVALTGAPDGVLAAIIVADLTALAATRASRWYVTGGFTTFIVISLLIYGAPGTAQGRFNERVLETLLGVAVAAIFGVAIPAWRRQRRGQSRLVRR
jgi:Fusaric acid resistance protein-like